MTIPRPPEPVPGVGNIARRVVDQRRWQTCPVCFGKGLVANGFYAFPGVTTYPATSTTPECCRSCAGRGIVR